MTTSTEEARCTFCGKSQEQVRSLIAGPGAAICDACVMACRDLMGEERGPDAPPLSAQHAVLAAIDALPRPATIAALGHLAEVGMELAGTDATWLRVVGHRLTNAMDFEDALRARARIAPFERTVSDALADAACHTRLGACREAIAVLDRLAASPLGVRLSAADDLAVTLARAYARLGCGPVFEDEVRIVRDDASRAAASLAALAMDAVMRRALENQHVHIRARAEMALRRHAEAIDILVAHLAERAYDVEALALIVDAYARTGDRAGAASAREKALRFAPTGGAYAARIAGIA